MWLVLGIIQVREICMFSPPFEEEVSCSPVASDVLELVDVLAVTRPYGKDGISTFPVITRNCIPLVLREKRQTTFAA